VIVKPVVSRKRACRDVGNAIDYYLNEASAKVALAFIDALGQAYVHLGRHPAAGSPRYAHELNLPDLRAWQVKGYPYVVFYVERERHVEVWRVLHGERDIPAWLQVPPAD
jgi:toxin ParE1/3/4